MYDDCRATPVCGLMLSDSCGSGFILYRFGLTIHIVLDNAVCTRDTVVAAPQLVAVGGHSPHSRQRTTPRPPCRCARTGSSAEFETDVENPGSGDSSLRTILTVVTHVAKRCQPVGDAVRLYRGHREQRTVVRTPVQPDPRCSRTFVGSFNGRSVGGKTTAMYDRIVTDRLHLCAVVETWHDAVDSPQLIACTPPGYSHIEKARPRSASAALTTPGGLCLFYASFISAREVPLPVYNSGIEVLTVYLRGARRNALAVVIYRPPTSP